MLKTLAADQKGILFTTHDPNQAYYMADRAALIREGVLLATGAVQEVIKEDNLQRPYDAEIKTIKNENSIRFLPLADSWNRITDLA